jgi:hypothetical protein
MDEWFTQHGGLLLWGAILGVIGATLVSLAFYWLSLKPRRFGWQVMSMNRILSVPDDERKKLRVIYGDDDVTDPNIVVLRIGNVGKAEIAKSDFDGHVTISFDKAKLLARSVTAVSSKDVRPQLGATVDLGTEGAQAAWAVSLEPMLLNPGEWFEIQFVTDGELVGPTLRGRIAGQKVLREIEFDNTPFGRRAGLIGTMIAAAVAVFTILEFLGVDTVSTTPVVVGGAVSIAIIISASLPRMWERSRAISREAPSTK